MHQTTLRKAVTCSGVGLHSGKPVQVTLRPAPADTGILFRLETPEGVRHLAPRPQDVMTTELATTLGRDGVSVSTVEHLLAAVRGMGLDNVSIDIEGNEVPILDGSAAEYAESFNRVGFWRLAAPRRVLRVNRPMELRDGNKCIRVKPSSGFRVHYTIDFPHPAIGRQSYFLDLTPQTFHEVAFARTFGFLRDVEWLHSRGLALGGSLDNAVVLNEHGVLNAEGLRSPDEFVRHKVLDFIGDMAMLSLPLQGEFQVFCSGHQLNNRFLRLLDEENALESVELDVRMRRQPLPRRSPAFEGALALA